MNSTIPASGTLQRAWASSLPSSIPTRSAQHLAAATLAIGSAGIALPRDLAARAIGVAMNGEIDLACRLVSTLQDMGAQLPDCNTRHGEPRALAWILLVSSALAARESAPGNAAANIASTEAATKPSDSERNIARVAIAASLNIAEGDAAQRVEILALDYWFPSILSYRTDPKRYVQTVFRDSATAASSVCIVDVLQKQVR